MTNALRLIALLAFAAWAGLLISILDKSFPEGRIAAGALWLQIQNYGQTTAAGYGINVGNLPAQPNVSSTSNLNNPSRVQTLPQSSPSSMQSQPNLQILNGSSNVPQASPQQADGSQTLTNYSLPK